MRAALSVGLLMVPTVLFSQEGASVYELAEHPDHAAHAGLHRPDRADAGVHLAALRTIGLDDDVAALCRAAELAMTIGLLTDPGQDSVRMAWFREAEAYARQAILVDRDSPDALFMEASALGLQMHHLPGGDRVQLANRVLAKTERILELDPDHPGGLHLRGRLAAEGMRVGPVKRFLVSRFMGGDVLSAASWEEAETSLRAALEAQPHDPMHRIELALVLRDTGREQAAREHLRKVLALPDSGLLMAYYKDRARHALRQMD